MIPSSQIAAPSAYGAGKAAEFHITVSYNTDPLRTHKMHEFQVLAVFAVIVAIYLGLFYASEHFFMKDKE